jgi:hypothetical protein
VSDIDLERLAAGYRHRPASRDELDHASAPLRGPASPRPGEWALDAGGGPGGHAAEWTRAGVRAVVLDPGRRMVARAARYDGVIPVAGTSQAMPFRDGVMALVYFHLSLHYGDWRTALQESGRVLRSGRECWIWTMTAPHFRRSWLARWFPSVPAIDTARFPGVHEIVEYLPDAGFESIAAGVVTDHVIRPAGELLAAVGAGYISTLQLLPDEELRSGVAALNAAYPDPEEIVDYELRYDRIVARRSLR